MTALPEDLILISITSQPFLHPNLTPSTGFTGTRHASDIQTKLPHKIEDNNLKSILSDSQAHTFNPITWEAEAGGSLSSRPD